MPIQNAIKLLNTIDTDDNLRKKLYSFSQNNELENYLSENNLKFTMEEFEEAVNFLHVQCQFKEQADDLFQKVELFRFLVSSLK